MSQGVVASSRAVNERSLAATDLARAAMTRIVNGESGPERSSVNMVVSGFGSNLVSVLSTMY